jgi:hypothetical protein
MSEKTSAKRAKVSPPPMTLKVMIPKNSVFVNALFDVTVVLQGEDGAMKVRPLICVILFDLYVKVGGDSGISQTWNWSATAPSPRAAWGRG